MISFIQRHRASVIGILNGLDRLRLRGTMRLLANVGGMRNFLWQAQVLLKDFKSYAQSITEQVRRSIEGVAESAGRPHLYLYSSSSSKEDRARVMAEQQGITEGLICLLSSVEPCFSFEVRRDREARKLELRGGSMKCKHYYHYCIHPSLGFLHVRMQTWFPFTIHICINGREWLARQMDQAGIGYTRRDNCFVDVADVEAAQALLDRQLQTNWQPILDKLINQTNPAHAEIFRKWKIPYYWSVDESEWASDVMFRSSGGLTALYPSLLRHGIQTLGCRDVMRFLGKRVPTLGGVDKSFKGEVVTDLRERPEGIRIKHQVKRNSVKMYNKQGSVLRVETTINDARDMKVYRAKEGDPKGAKKMRYMRKSVADLYQRAELCQNVNDRYLEAMAVAESTEPLKSLAEPLCSPVRWKGKQVRAINPMNAEDAALLEAVSRGEFILHGFRNRDLQPLLFGQQEPSKADAKRRSGAMTRRLRMLRAHGLIHKITKTHRYKVSPKGRVTITALLSARQADTKKLIQAA